MPKSIDALSEARTAELRGLAVAYFPDGRTSRMARPILVAFILAAMADEEYALRTSRRARTTPEQFDFAAMAAHRTMRDRYGRCVFDQYLASASRTSDDRFHTHEQQSAEVLSQGGHEQQSPEVLSQGGNDVPSPLALWPTPVTHKIKDDCMSAFREGTTLHLAATCAVCARRTFSKDILFTPAHLSCDRVSINTVPLEILRIDDPFILDRPGEHFNFGHPDLDGLALHRSGLHLADSPPQIDICNECASSLQKCPPKLPRLALANGNIRGFLPESLQD
ncbi:hypothetical protein A4X13_0g9528, partial [Tilletia indica]